MKKSLSYFLQAVVVLIGLGALALLLWEPQTEGVNVHATNFEIYFKDPFLALVYVGSIAFFVALFQIWKLLQYARKNRIFSQAGAKAISTVKYCAITIIGFVAAEEVFIMFTHSQDDATGAFALGVLIILGSIFAAAAARRFEKKLQSAANINS